MSAEEKPIKLTIVVDPETYRRLYTKKGELRVSVSDIIEALVKSDCLDMIERKEAPQPQKPK